MSDIKLADVMIHIDADINDKIRSQVEASLRGLEDVVSVSMPEDKPHLVIVEYNPDKDQGFTKETREAQQKLLEAVITAKHELSEATTTSIDIPNFIQDETGQPHHIDNFEITREQLKRL